MIVVWIALLALAVLAPLLLVLRTRTQTRGAREPAMDLHRTQLRELDRDLAEGRLLPSEHQSAVLEVQRRLLAVAATQEVGAKDGARWPVLATAAAVPLVAVGLYLASGSQPFMPSVRGSSEDASLAQQNQMVEELRIRLAMMDPATDVARQGYLLLGSVEETRGNPAAAAVAYRAALGSKFDPLVAARAAEAATRAEGGVSESSAALFRRALAAAPDAPWRAIVEARLKEPRLP